MKAPRHLSHKPIFEVEGYEKIDGKYAGKSDAKALSIGIAQWNSHLQTELSAKVWRKTDERWSRQSEELPLHRVIDLATMICAVKKAVESNEEPKAGELPITKSSGDYIDVLKKELDSNKHLKQSLIRLKETLNSLNLA